MDFVAIDFETANEDVSSICQVGVARFKDGHTVGEWCTLVDPCSRFAGINTAIHGISAETVKGAPKFVEVAGRLFGDIRGKIVATHTPFDRAALRKAAGNCGAPLPHMQWIDTACVARRAWINVARSGYGLANVCQIIDYPFKHHDALEDAKASGAILLAAIRASNLTLEQWLVRVTQPIDPTADLPIRRKGNPEGELFGEIIVFTGALTIARREAADLAAEAGCEVEDGVTKRTTMLVVGVQDIDRLNGYEKSAKQRKAEDLCAKGQAIRILFEDDFKEIVASAAIIA